MARYLYSIFKVTFYFNQYKQIKCYLILGDTVIFHIYVLN